MRGSASDRRRHHSHSSHAAFRPSRVAPGQRGWRAFIEAVTDSDDQVERHYLEVKSQLDLNSKRDWHKVVKFILATANRDPDTARRALDGHPVMLLGV